MHKKMKLPVTVTEVLATLKAKSKVKGQESKPSKENQEPFDFEEILKVIGHYGWWQCRIFVLFAIVVICDGLYENLFYFTAYTPKYRCSIPFCELPSNTSYYEYNKTFAKYVKLGIPEDILQLGESCEYLGFVQIPAGMDQETILNKVTN